MKKYFFLLAVMAAFSLSSCIKVDDDAIYNGHLNKEQRAEWAKKASGRYSGAATFGFSQDKLADKPAEVEFSINGSDSTLTIPNLPVSLLSNIVTDNNRLSASLATAQPMQIGAVLHPTFLGLSNTYSYFLVFKPTTLAYDVYDISDGRRIPVEVTFQSQRASISDGGSQSEIYAIGYKLMAYEGRFDFYMPISSVKIDGKRYETSAFFYLSGKLE